MKKQLKWTSLILTAGLLAGCYTTGLSPREQGANRFSELVYGFCEQQDPPINIPQPIRTPMRLGVAQIGETAPPKQLMNELQQHPSLIREVIEIPLSGDPGNRWNYYQKSETDDPDRFRRQAETMRVLGQQLGADYILMIGGNIDSHVEALPLEVLDMAILPAVIIPSKKIEMDARASGALINTKTGRLEFLLTTTSESVKNCPSAYVSQTREKMSMDQRSVLCKQLTDELITKLTNAH